MRDEARVKSITENVYYKDRKLKPRDEKRRCT